MHIELTQLSKELTLAASIIQANLGVSLLVFSPLLYHLHPYPLFPPLSLLNTLNSSKLEEVCISSFASSHLVIFCLNNEMSTTITIIAAFPLGNGKNAKTFTFGLKTMFAVSVYCTQNLSH